MKTKLMILSLIALVFLFSGISATAQTVEVTIPDMYDTTGAKIAIPIKVSDVTGLVISSYSFTLAFDPAVLEADDYSSTGALTDGWLTFLSKKTGEVIVAAAGTDTLKGSGVLVYVNFTVIGDVGSKTTVAFSQFAFNEGSPSANTNDGSFSVPKVTHGPVCGAVTATSARFVIRTDFPTQAQIFLSQDSNNWTNPVRSGIFNILAENENFVLIDVNNLTPNTTYCYTAD
ncbi:MAG TPA: cohesin domain-containing protein, partial [bacterium]